MSAINEATEKLSNSINELYNNNPKDLFVLIKKQSEEIDRRGQIVMKMDESIRLQQQNIQRLQEQNKHLESMVEDLKLERQKLLEEIGDLKSKKTTVRKGRTKKTMDKESDTTATEAI